MFFWRPVTAAGVLSEEGRSEEREGRGEDEARGEESGKEGRRKKKRREKRRGEKRRSAFARREREEEEESGERKRGRGAGAGGTPFHGHPTSFCLHPQPLTLHSPPPTAQHNHQRFVRMIVNNMRTAQGGLSRPGVAGWLDRKEGMRTCFLVSSSCCSSTRFSASALTICSRETKEHASTSSPISSNGTPGIAMCDFSTGQVLMRAQLDCGSPIGALCSGPDEDFDSSFRPDDDVDRSAWPDEDEDVA